MSESTTVWRVMLRRGDCFCSPLVGPEPPGVIGKLGEVIKPKFGKLFCFSSEELALRWFANVLPSGAYAVIEGEGKGVTKPTTLLPGLWEIQVWEEFWRRFPNKESVRVLLGNEFMQPPVGCLLVSEFKMEKVLHQS